MWDDIMNIISTRGRDFMILAKGKPTIIIKRENYKEFIEECNKNVITQSFKEECRKASKLFKKK